MLNVLLLVSQGTSSDLAAYHIRCHILFISWKEMLFGHLCRFKNKNSVFLVIDENSFVGPVF